MPSVLIFLAYLDSLHFFNKAFKNTRCKVPVAAPSWIDPNTCEDARLGGIGTAVYDPSSLEDRYERALRERTSRVIKNPAGSEDPSAAVKDYESREWAYEALGGHHIESAKAVEYFLR